MMRIITGTAKGKRLATLEGEATRPTTEKVKEAVFSSLQFDIEGRQVLDLFAGSGQLGLEAMSRGAAGVKFIDSSIDAMAIVKANAQKTGFFDRSRFLVSDYRNYIRKAAGSDSFDIVFIDPPYAMRAAADALSRLYAAGMLKVGAIAVCESEEDIFVTDPKLECNFDRIKTAKYGRTMINIVRLVGKDE